MKPTPGGTLKDKSDVVAPRRGFLKSVAAAGVALPLVPGRSEAADSAASQPVALPAPAAGYVCLSQDEAAFVEAIVNVMCPADEYTPNGVDCGLAVYIDRQLAGDFGRGARRYMRGPWHAGKPEHGYQSPLPPEQFFKLGLAAADAACEVAHGKPFDQLEPAQADTFLKRLAVGEITDPSLNMASWFNEIVLPLFNQACFADPIYGGNNDKIFWRLIGYPGLPATNTINMVQYRGKPFPGAKDPKSIADFS
ncbi:gluconate 2-dehydrogenase subunit 3 family protein [Pelomonas cellulosilytica]|uniref:Gluconate 2-dehydrogenase subunit 3 family protein n=1 Tax=Pelomonas cellulosilytica TaxID=2906762 RepID=A0ABS8Y1N6_9BURK|nr:gluconate 2-dehydrogenase subunit 3 family protein [Pelomonas sp. P8]MCE4556836.1 gluconate 2-dehydrogenase subunit 3 family protein [Pelomonas sp. P8]